MTSLWDQLAFTEPKELGSNAVHCTYRGAVVVQYLIVLRDDFEGIRGTILHHSPLPSVDSVVNELLAEEIRLTDEPRKALLFLPNQPVLVTTTSNQVTAQSSQASRTPTDECSFCHQKGHWKAQCPKLLNCPSFGQHQSRKKSGDKYTGQQQSWKKSGNRHTVATTSLVEDQSPSLPSLRLISEQLNEMQKLLSTNQPNTLSVSSLIGLSSSTSPGTSRTT